MTLHTVAHFEGSTLRLLGAVPEHPPQDVRVTIDFADVPGVLSPPTEPLAELLDWEEIAACRREAAGAPTLEEVRARLASIPGSMSDAVVAARQERF